MRRPFLEILAEYLDRTAKDEREDVWILLPNKRAGVFLQHHLASRSKKVRWAPRVLTMDELVGELSDLEAADPLELLFGLYDIYSQLAEKPESLDQFYYWGETMLRDFDELDKYLVDAEMLFRNIIDLKELEDPFAGLDEEQLAFIRRFWEGFHSGTRTEEKESFLATWKLLPLLYHKLNLHLKNAGKGYQGMLYREIAGMVAENSLDPPDAGRLVIAGFNALNVCEKRIFSWLRQHGAEFFWDYDRSYTDGSSRAAGRFIRSNLNMYPPPVELEDFSGIESDKQIRIFEVPSDLMQAKIAGRILEEESAEPAANATDRAVILCDEELLMPVCMSLPDQESEINITMGYPMKQSAVSGLVDLLLRMQENLREAADGTVQLYYKDVLSILHHPLVSEGAGDPLPPLAREIYESNRIFVDRADIQGAFGQRIFSRVRTACELIGYLREVFLQILERIADRERGKRVDLHRELVFRLLIQLNKLQMLAAGREELSLRMISRLIRRYMARLTVPFEGEPLRGLQIMGILETRLLDFRHVILLSVNEEIMPGETSRQSFIPYTLRLGYSMPSRQEMDGIYAYYFYRILQRAERIDLIFNSKSEGARTGEMSRYLYQLLYDRGCRVIRPGMEVASRTASPIEIPHSGLVDRKLSRFLEGNAHGRYLSPSAINTYIDCPLKFYFRYVEGIAEPDEVQEEIDAPGFGTVVHEALSNLYREAALRGGGLIRLEDLEEMERPETYRQVLRKAFLEHHFRGGRHAAIEGRNIIIFSVMEKYLERIIGVDKSVAPFVLLAAEVSFERHMEIQPGNRSLRVRLGGKVDRVDRTGGRIRVIDYKTGEAKRGFGKLEELFDPDLARRNAAALQVLFYAWLVKEAYPNEEIVPGLYAMKQISSNESDPFLEMGRRSGKEKVSSLQPLVSSFESLISRAVTSIFDTRVPFSQTTHHDRCTRCDYAKVCNRESVD